MPTRYAEELYEVLKAGRWLCPPAAHLHRSRIPAGARLSRLPVREQFRHASTLACTRAGARGSVPGCASDELQQRYPELSRKGSQSECLFALRVSGAAK
eukprot:4737762-Pyramimonas_sp.AAC.1